MTGIVAAPSSVARIHAFFGNIVAFVASRLPTVTYDKAVAGLTKFVTALEKAEAAHNAQADKAAAKAAELRVAAAKVDEAVVDHSNAAAKASATLTNLKALVA